MSVYKPKNSPFYHYDFWHRGQRFSGSTGTTDRKSAIAFEKSEKGAAKQSVNVVPVNALSLDVAIKEYWQRHAQYKKTSKDIKGKLKRLVTRIGPSKFINLLTNKDISDYIQVRREEVENASVNSDLRLLRAAINFCGDNLDAHIPKINWATHFLDEPEGRTRVLSLEEEKKLFGLIRTDYHDLIDFCILTGCRVSSARNLKWTDFEDGYIRLTVKSKKTKDVLRLPISPDMLEMFDRLKGQHETYVFTYVCIRENKKQKGKRYPFSQSGWTRTWRKALEKCEIKDFRFHDLRHTAATRMLKDTSNLVTVQNTLGHKDMKSTLRYAHAANDDLLRALSRTKSRT